MKKITQGPAGGEKGGADSPPTPRPQQQGGGPLPVRTPGLDCTQVAGALGVSPSKAENKNNDNNSDAGPRALGALGGDGGGNPISRTWDHIARVLGGNDQGPDNWRR